MLLTLPMQAELALGHHKSVAVLRGPLVYGLKIGEDWRQVNAEKPGHELPHGDWEVYAATPWNYGLKIKEKTLDRDVVFENRPLGENPFSPEGAPVMARVQGRRLPGWSLINGSAGENPQSPGRVGRTAGGTDPDPVWVHQFAGDGISNPEAAGYAHGSIVRYLFYILPASDRP